jgi:hypothetical protein
MLTHGILATNEPVAWAVYREDTLACVMEHDPMTKFVGETVVPLYAAPPRVVAVDEKMEPESFSRALAALLNKYSIENDSNTPDYALASYLAGCLNAFESAVKMRDTFHGKDIARVYVEANDGE